MSFKAMPKLPLVLIALMIVVGVALYPQLPARVPVHWGIGGQIDGWAAKSLLSVLFAPLLTLVLYVVLWLVPQLDPQRANLLRSGKAYGLIIEVVSAFMCVVFVGQLYSAFDNTLPMGRIVIAGTGVLFIVIGRIMPSVKRNWTMGVRYSWTLSDDVVWEKTNALAGALFSAAGVLAIVGAFLPPVVGFVLILGPAFIILPVTYVYSMRLYRERHPEEMGRPTPIDHTPAENPAPTIHEADPNAPRIERACPACGAENAPGNERCIACGAELPQA